MISLRKKTMETNPRISDRTDSIKAERILLLVFTNE